jgi:hypothetical protein
MRTQLLQPYHQARRYAGVLWRALLLTLGLIAQGLVPAAIVWLTAELVEVVMAVVGGSALPSGL